MFFYLKFCIIRVFLQCRGNFVHGYNKSKYCDSFKFLQKEIRKFCFCFELDTSCTRSERVKYLCVIRNCWEFLVAMFLIYDILSMVCAYPFNYVQFAVDQSQVLVWVYVQIYVTGYKNVCNFCTTIPDVSWNMRSLRGLVRMPITISCSLVEVFIFCRSTKQEGRHILGVLLWKVQVAIKRNSLIKLKLFILSKLCSTDQTQY